MDRAGNVPRDTEPPERGGTQSSWKNDRVIFSVTGTYMQPKTQFDAKILRTGTVRPTRSCLCVN